MKKGQLGPKTGEEILSLREAVSQAQAQYFLTFEQSVNPMERGDFLLDEMTATLEYLLDDGIEDEKDAQLDRIDAAHADDPESFDALASALDDYAAFADVHRKAMDGLGGFDAGHIDEARKVAAELRARPSVGATVSEASRAALALRNKLVVLLMTRMTAVRAAARFVFRGQPEIVREVTSEYERRRRAAGFGRGADGLGLFGGAECGCSIKSPTSGGKAHTLPRKIVRGERHRGQRRPESL